MSSVLQHFNFETSAGFVNILVVMLLNRSFIHSLLLVLTTIMLFFIDSQPTNSIASRKFQTQQHASSHSPGSLAISLQFQRNYSGFLSIKELFSNFYFLYINVRACTNNVAPSYFTKLLSKYIPTRTLLSGNMQLLKKQNETTPGVTDLSLLQLLVFGMNCHQI